MAYKYCYSVWRISLQIRILNNSVGKSIDMYCDFCGKKSSSILDDMADGYDGQYFCDEECRDKFRCKFDDNI